MQFQWQTTAVRAASVALALAAAGCTLPRSGPTAAEIYESSELAVDGVQIVPVSPGIARAANFDERLGFGADFVGAGVVRRRRHQPGDTLKVRVWESVDTGLLAGVGQKVTALNGPRSTSPAAYSCPTSG